MVVKLLAAKQVTISGQHPLMAWPVVRIKSIYCDNVLRKHSNSPLFTTVCENLEFCKVYILQQLNPKAL